MPEQVIRAELGYLSEKEFPQVKSFHPGDCIDNSLVENLERSGFFASIGIGKQR